MSVETIIMFSGLDISQNIEISDLNISIKNCMKQTILKI